MKILLTTLNAKYIHTSLALRYLEQVANRVENVEVMRKEFSINAQLEQVLQEIYLTKPMVVAFSCYIWNVEMIAKIITNLKKIVPQIIIVAGGPEVSHDPVGVMAQIPAIDIIVKGEGEDSFAAVVQALAQYEQNGNNNSSPTHHLAHINNIYWRESQEIRQGQTVVNCGSLDQIPSPYQGDLTEFKEKIAYLETSRGCPFSCSYCLSSVTRGVRYLPLDKIKEQLKELIAAQVKQVKFVDRTFNVHKERAMAIWQFLIAQINEQQSSDINFHFEITGHLLDDEMIAFLKQVPAGLFQFEIGVQSTNEATLKAINRRDNFSILKEKVTAIRAVNNIHLHLDLIAGLPYEDFNSFVNSFNQVMTLEPHRLQLGFLKLLKGAPIRDQIDKYGYVYTEEPPYEVLANKFISYEEILVLKEVEELLEKLYNSHQFHYSMKYMLNIYEHKFDFFIELRDFCQATGKNYRQLKQKDYYELLLLFAQKKMMDKVEMIRQLLTLDLLRMQRITQLPNWTGKKVNQQLSQQLYQILSQDKHKRAIFGEERSGLEYKRLAGQIYLDNFPSEVFSFVFDINLNNAQEKCANNTILFDYGAVSDPIIGGARMLSVEL